MYTGPDQVALCSDFFQDRSKFPNVNSVRCSVPPVSECLVCESSISFKILIRQNVSTIMCYSM